MSNDKAAITLFKTTWDSFNYRVKNELKYAKDDVPDNIALKYDDIMEHYNKYRQHLEAMNHDFEKPHNLFYKKMVKNFDNILKKINEVFLPLVEKEQD